MREAGVKLHSCAPEALQQRSDEVRHRSDQSSSRGTHHELTWVDWRLLETSGRAGVWRDLVQVFGGKLSMRLPTSVTGVAQLRSAFPPGTVPERG